ncbi:peroxiredoxin family protein [Mucilaginibacter aquariorum]|uniref:TlpA family protein disulfide reductase n=1 Tax=Mucilaginibacter aquariorum TaxID=2967225 RepID=A0ABT1T5U2_9SPHI|nr:TlpA disulfide reductase family protein [Mucilaginibacter aquariorum]MCQ6960001.1 TlpA family protein disulfide reductase [Mucilaginibacter aquariorum]
MNFKNYLSKAKYLTLGVLLSGAALAGDKVPGAKFIKEGVWRGVFTVSESQVPFNFEFKGKDPEHAVFTLINGSRRDDFHVQRLGKDSVYIKMNTYDAALVAKIQDDGKISGEYRSLVPGFRGNALPFTAEYGKSYRFVEPGKDVAPAADLSGKWEIKTYSKEAVPASIAIIKQKGNKLTGVIMTVVGDTRELEGTIQGDEFALSGFTGPSPFIVKGKVNADGTISGEQGFGIYKNLKFDATKNANVELPDPYKLTFLKEGYKKLDFSFPGIDGKQISLSDQKYKGKVVIIEVIGTWCPNCTDQTVFLSPWFNKNRQRGVEAIAIGFEQKDSLEYAKYTLGKLKQKYNINYDIAFGGLADKKLVSQKLPALNKFVAFPTTIIVDRKGDVREIYTGYTGTVTGKYHNDYEKKFNKLLDELIAEPAPETAQVIDTDTRQGN